MHDIQRSRMTKHAFPFILSILIGMLPAAAFAQECGESVTVTSGDTLYEIAQECETTVSAIVETNPKIDDPRLIRVGWTLTIPDGDGDAPTADQPERRDPIAEPDPDPTGVRGVHTVRPGDTLGEIASRFGVTISALLRANPHIDDPDVIDVGLEVQIPRADDRDGEREPREPRRASWVGNVAIEPDSGPPGSTVRVQASGFPPYSRVNIGAGRAGSEYEVVRSGIQTNANGSFVARAELPEYADPRTNWIFVVETVDHRIKGRSEPFDVTSEAGDRDRSIPDDRVVVRGQLTDEGVECPVVRGRDGTLYTLAGDIGRFEEGDYVRVEGTPAEVSICMQGRTINVDRIMIWKEGGAVDDDRGDDNLRKVHRIEGVIGPGAECPVLRTDDGETYALTGELDGFDQGDRVVVEGTEAEASFCMQGTTLNVRSIRSAR